jgi:hypothetical protein
MSKHLVALAITIAFGGGLCVGWLLRGAPSDVGAAPVHDETRRPTAASASGSSKQTMAPEPTIANKPEPTATASDGIAIVDPMVWPSIASGGYVWPTTLPKAGTARKIDDTHFQVDRQVIADAGTMKHVRVVPSLATTTQPAGVRLFGIRAGSPISDAGLRNGDTLVYVDEYAMDAPDKALEAYARLRLRPELALRIVRDGKPVVLHYQMTDAPKSATAPPVVAPTKKP